MPSSSDLPEWRRAYHCLRGLIEDGMLCSGQVLPTQTALSKEFSVSRHAVRRAISMLARQEVIVANQGMPARVAAPKVSFLLSDRTRFSSAVDRLGRSGSAEILGVKYRAPPVRIAKLLGMKGVRPVQVAEILRRLDGVPLSLSRHYFSEKCVPDIALALDANSSITMAFRALGISDYQRECTLIESRVPTAHEALLLEAARGNHVLCTIGRNIRPDQTPLEVSESAFRADRVTLEVMHPDLEQPHLGAPL